MTSLSTRYFSGRNGRSWRPGPLFSTAVLCCATLLTQTLHAESYGPARPRGNVQRRGGTTAVLAAENLFGLTSLKTTIEPDGPGAADVESKVAQLSFLGGGLNNPYALPRLGLDFRLGQSFTLGGALGFSSGTLGLSADGDDDPSYSNRNIHVRAGLLFGQRLWGFWPRLGFANYAYSEEGLTGDSEYSGTAIALEAPILLKGDWFGANFGPVFYLPLGGSYEFTPADGSLSSVRGSTSIGGWGISVGGFVML